MRLPSTTTLQIAAAVGLLLGSALLSSKLSKGAPALLPEEKREPAPGFSLQDANGKTVRLADFKGKVVLLNFWATWCGPCKLEIPWFTEFQEKQGAAGLVVLGVSLDDEGWKAVKPFLEKMTVNYTVVLGDDAVAAKYGGVDSLPETLLLDQQGRIAARHVGLTPKATLETGIARLLRQ